MRKVHQKIRNVMIAMILMGVFALSVTSAWAALSFVNTRDAAGPTVTKADISQIPETMSQKFMARAPEPATMVMFGGGFLGMMIGFIRKTYAFTKRVLDVIATIIGSIILSPLLLLTALLVKLPSKGPALYSQVRVGKDGTLFKIYKFRTMKVDAEKDTGPIWAAADDNRLTPIGGFLRKTHIDELPQLINIFKGPKPVFPADPSAPVFVEKFKEDITDYEKRLHVKPGITGLAQVWHRYDETIEDVKKKLKYDLLYVKKMCLQADFNIFMRTFRVVLTGEGAR